MKTLGLDIGTTSISCVVMDSCGQLAVRTLPNDTYLQNARSWAREQDVAAIWQKCEQCIADLLLEWPDIEAIGIAGQMHGIVYLNANGEAVSPLFTWEDGRGDLLYQNGESYAACLSRITGHSMSTGFGLTTHFYNLINGLVPTDASKISTIMDYVAMKLCGAVEPSIHASNASGLGLFDIEKNCFDLAALAAAGIDPAILPRVLDGEEIVGETAQGIKVTVPIGDVQAGIFGLVQDDSDVVINIGTSSQVSSICQSPCAPDGLESRPFVQGKYIMLGAGLCGGSSFQLLNSFFRDVCRVFSEEVYQDAVYEKMVQAAAQAFEQEQSKVQAKIETEHLIVLPLFRGKRSDPELRGSISNISVTNFTPGELALGFFHGVCSELYDAYEKMPALPDDGRLLLCGNALRKNPLLRQICAEVFGREGYLGEFSEETAVGAAKLAAVVCSG